MTALRKSLFHTEHIDFRAFSRHVNQTDKVARIFGTADVIHLFQGLKGLFQKEVLYPLRDILPESCLPFQRFEGQM